MFFLCAIGHPNTLSLLEEEREKNELDEHVVCFEVLIIL